MASLVRRYNFVSVLIQSSAFHHLFTLQVKKFQLLLVVIKIVHEPLSCAVEKLLRNATSDIEIVVSLRNVDYFPGRLYFPALNIVQDYEFVCTSDKNRKFIH